MVFMLPASLALAVAGRTGTTSWHPDDSGDRRDREVGISVHDP
jgi:hypothetical protein